MHIAGNLLVGPYILTKKNFHSLCFKFSQGQDELKISDLLFSRPGREGKVFMLSLDVFFKEFLFPQQANHYYKLFITWTNQKIRNTFVQRNMFEFKHIKVRLITPPGAVSLIGIPPTAV